MQFPVVLCRLNTLIVVGRDFFELVGQLEESSGRLESAVTKTGRASFHWILDNEGLLYPLTSLGLVPKGLMEMLGIRRRREQFKIEPAVVVTASHLSKLISELEDSSPDFPNVSDLKQLLERLPPEQVLNREILREYFGE